MVLPQPEPGEKVKFATGTGKKMTVTFPVVDGLPELVTLNLYSPAVVTVYIALVAAVISISSFIH